MKHRIVLARDVQREISFEALERELPPRMDHLERSLLMSRTSKAAATVVDARRALTRTDLVLCALPISLFLSIVSLV